MANTKPNNTFLGLSAGKVLQIVTAELTTTASTNSATFSDTGLTANITPSSTSNKVLCQWQIHTHPQNSYYSGFDLRRGGTRIYPNPTSPSNRIPCFGVYAIADGGWMIPVSGSYLDTPASVSTLTYAIYFAHIGGGGAYTYVNRSSGDSDVSYAARGSSTIILMEIEG